MTIRVSVLILTVLVLFLMSGCARVPQVMGTLVGVMGAAVGAPPSPYKAQAKALDAAYRRDELTANQYHRRLTELEGLDLQWRQGQQAAELERQRIKNERYRVQKPIDVRIVP